MLRMVVGARALAGAVTPLLGPMYTGIRCVESICRQRSWSLCFKLWHVACSILNYFHVKVNIRELEFSNLASDWLAAQTPAIKRHVRKTLLVYMDLNKNISRQAITLVYRYRGTTDKIRTTVWLRTGWFKGTNPMLSFGNLLELWKASALRCQMTQVIWLINPILLWKSQTCINASMV